MNPKKIKSTASALVALAALSLGAGKAMAISVLTFDSGNASDNTTLNALGFSVTHIGADALATVDFSQYDVIYVSQTYADLQSTPLLTALDSRYNDLKSYVASGGGVVFGSPDVGAGAGGIVTTDPSNPVLNAPNAINVSGLDLGPLPQFITDLQLAPTATDNGTPVLIADGAGSGRLVAWNPAPSDVTQPTDVGIQLVDNSITWAAGHPSSIPEPATWAMMAFGLIGLVLVRRRFA